MSWHIGKTWSTVLAISFVMASAIVLGSCKSAEPILVQPMTESISIDSPSEELAGATVPITVRVEPPQSDIYVDLLAFGTFGLVPQRLIAQDGIAHGELPLDVTRFAGAIELRAQVGDVSTEKKLIIRPKEAVDPVTPLIGPRSIVANGKDWTMLVATPRDRFHNALDDGTALTIAIQHPNSNQPRRLETEVKHLLAWKRITSRTKAGKTFLGVRSGNAYGPERMVLEVPGQPVPFELASEKTTYQADGRRLVRINSEEIKDKYGNILLDGTAGLLIVEIDGNLSRSIPAYLVDGRIFATLQAPAKAMTMNVFASIGGVDSELLKIDFEQGLAVKPIAVQVKQNEDSVHILAGPILGALEQYVPDSTEVTFILKDEMGNVLQFVGVSDQGYSELTLKEWTLEANRYTVNVSAGDGSGKASFQLRE